MVFMAHTFYSVHYEQIKAKKMHTVGERRTKKQTYECGIRMKFNITEESGECFV